MESFIAIIRRETHVRQSSYENCKVVSRKKGRINLTRENELWYPKARYIFAINAPERVEMKNLFSFAFFIGSARPPEMTNYGSVSRLAQKKYFQILLLLARYVHSQ